MYRLLLILGLLLLLYFLLRSTVREFLRGHDQGRKLTDKNRMVQDPVCRTYVPQGTAVSATIGGQTYYFCSKVCAETFQRQLSG